MPNYNIRMPNFILRNYIFGKCFFAFFARQSRIYFNKHPGAYWILTSQVLIGQGQLSEMRIYIKADLGSVSSNVTQKKLFNPLVPCVH